MHPRDKTHIKTGIKHEMWVWKAIFYAVLNQIAFFFDEWFRLQTSVSVHGKGKTTFQSKVFSSSCLFLILRRIVEGLLVWGKLSHVELRDKLENKLLAAEPSFF